MKKKSKIIIIIICILILLIGASFAFFQYVYTTNISYIEKHQIELEFLESSETINLTNGLPMSDKQGIAQTETFDFQVKTTTKSDTSIGYILSIEKLEATTGNTRLDDSAIKIYLTDFEDKALINPTLISDLNSYELYKKYHKHDDEQKEIKSKYKVKIWLDSAVDVSDWNQETNFEYSFKIKVNALNKETYKVVFNSNNEASEKTVQYIGYDEAFELEKNNFEYEGYNFDGWSTSEGGLVAYEDRETVTNIIEEEATEVNLYAQWENQKSYKNYKFFDLLEEEAVSDNIASTYVTNEEGIQFDSPSSTTNGKGIYTLSETANDTYPIHYYRGAVTNNNVILDNYCWKILRTTETGGTKLIYNGVKSEDGKCNNTGSATLLYSGKGFNSTGIGIAGAGYAYTDATSLKLSAKTDKTMAEGTIFANDVTYNESTGLYTLSEDRYITTSNFTEEKYDNIKEHHYTCLKTTDEGCSSVYYFYMGRDVQTYYATLKNGMKVDELLNIEFNGNSTNETKSTINALLETWYAENMTGFNSYLEDTVFCNDRTVHNAWTTTSSIENNNDLKIQFGSKMRVAYTLDISVDCPNKADSFTTTTNLGNGKLAYPIGLITFDEAALAGQAWNKDSTNSFIYNEKVWWTMSPGFVSATGVYMGVIHSMIDHVAVNYVSGGAGGVRPIISLVNDIKIEDGAGTPRNPFTIKSK